MTSFLVPLALGGVLLVVVIIASTWASVRARMSPGRKTRQSQGPRILIHSINDDRCTGCDACVAVCPTNVLDLVDNKSRVISFQDCIQCEACMWACPTEALVMHPEGTEPPKVKQPDLDDVFQTRVPGQYLIGEVAGKPLVKNAANLGRAVIEHIVSTGLQPNALGDRGIDVAIVGSGPGGLSAALSCIYHGLTYAIFEKEHIVASTIARYPKGKLIMAEPYDAQNFSFLPVFDSSKEETIPIWEDMIARLGVKLLLGEAVEAVKPGKGSFEVTTTQGKHIAQRIVLSTGLRGKPRTLGVPGENQPKVTSLLEDADLHRGQAVCVAGGGDSALEAAIALADAGAKVVLTYRGRSFNRAQPKNKSTVEAYAAERRIKVQYNSQVLDFGKDTVTIRVSDGKQKVYPNQAAFVLIGADPPIKWLSTLGIQYIERPHMHATGRPDALVKRFDERAAPCPENAVGACAMIARTSIEDVESRPKPVSRMKKMVRSATGMFSVASKLEKPMPLAEFAKESRKRHSGKGRRDNLKPGERTRVLRMLRDEGGRLADEDSQQYQLPPEGHESYDGGGMSMASAYGSQPAETEHGGSRAPAYPDPRSTYERQPQAMSVMHEHSLAPMTLEGPILGGGNEIKPKQAVILGLARATAEGPRSRREVPSPVPVKVPGRTSGPPSPIPNFHRRRLRPRIPTAAATASPPTTRPAWSTPAWLHRACHRRSWRCARWPPFAATIRRNR